MVTYFNRKDLVQFGEYLLSEERTSLISESYNSNDNVSLEERLKSVYHADVENFLNSKKEK